MARRGRFPAGGPNGQLQPPCREALGARVGEGKGAPPPPSVRSRDLDAWMERSLRWPRSQLGLFGRGRRRPHSPAVTCVRRMCGRVDTEQRRRSGHVRVVAIEAQEALGLLEFGCLFDLCLCCRRPSSVVLWKDAGFPGTVPVPPRLRLFSGVSAGVHIDRRRTPGGRRRGTGPRHRLRKRLSPSRQTLRLLRRSWTPASACAVAATSASVPRRPFTARHSFRVGSVLTPSRSR